MTYTPRSLTPQGNLEVTLPRPSLNNVYSHPNELHVALALLHLYNLHLLIMIIKHFLIIIPIYENYQEHSQGGGANRKGGLLLVQNFLKTA